MIYGLESEWTEEICNYKLAQINKLQFCLLWMSNVQKNYKIKYECGCIIQLYVLIHSHLQTWKIKE